MMKVLGHVVYIRSLSASKEINSRCVEIQTGVLWWRAWVSYLLKGSKISGLKPLVT